MKFCSGTLFLLISSLTLLPLWACGGSSHNNNDSPAPAVQTANSTPANTSTDASSTDNNSGAALGSPLNCEAAWTKFVAAHPTGLVVAYVTTSTTKNAADEVIFTSSQTFEEQVTASDANHVLTQRTTNVEGLPQPTVTSSDLTKTVFVSSCSKVSGLLAGTPLDVNVQVQQVGAQTITVAAGTFPTTYVKGKTGSSELGQSDFQSWTMQDGSTILVKAIVETATDVSGVTMTGTVTTELSKLQRP